MAQTATATRRAGISAEEWQVRVQLAACYRIFAMLGLDDLIYTHISARVRGPRITSCSIPSGCSTRR